MNQGLVKSNPILCYCSICYLPIKKKGITSHRSCQIRMTHGTHPVERDFHKRHLINSVMNDDDISVMF